MDLDHSNAPVVDGLRNQGYASPHADSQARGICRSRTRARSAGGSGKLGRGDLRPLGSGSLFSDSVTAAGGAAGRGVVREPDLGQVHADLPASDKGRAGKRFSATVPVYFHVVTDGKIGALTQTQIDAQMTVLNRTFAGAEGGATSGFRFQLAGVTRTDNADWFYGVGGLGGGEEHDMKHALHRAGLTR